MKKNFPIPFKMYLKLWRIVSLKVRARMNVAAMSLLINLHTGTFNVAVCIRQTLWDFLGEVFKFKTL